MSEEEWREDLEDEVSKYKKKNPIPVGVLKREMYGKQLRPSEGVNHLGRIGAENKWGYSAPAER